MTAAAATGKVEELVAATESAVNLVQASPSYSTLVQVSQGWSQLVQVKERQVKPWKSTSAASRSRLKSGDKIKNKP